MVIPECASPAGRRVLPRRPVLLALAAVLAAPSAGLLTGCGSGEPDPLVALAAAAREDAARIDALLAAPGGGAALGGRLAPVAEARRAHAQALAVELGETEPSAAPSVPPAGGANPASALSEVRAALDVAQRQAAALVASLPRRRAALVGSIAAGCAAQRVVLE